MDELVQKAGTLEPGPRQVSLLSQAMEVADAARETGACHEDALLKLANLVCFAKNWLEHMQASALALAVETHQAQHQTEQDASAGDKKQAEQARPGAVVESHALATAVTPHQAWQLAQAGAAGWEHPVIRRTQKAGKLTSTKTNAITVAAGRSEDPVVQQQVIDLGVKLAPTQPAHKVKAACERFVAHADVDALQRGRTQEAANRRIWLKPLPYGMALLGAYGPAEQLRGAMATIEQVARSQAGLVAEAASGENASKVGPTGEATIRQRRFDVLVRMLSGDSGVPPKELADRARSIHRLTAHPHFLVRVEAATLFGLSNDAADILPGPISGAGVQAIPPEQVRLLAQHATWQTLVTEAGRVIGLGDQAHPPPGEGWGTGWEGGSGPAWPPPEEWPSETLSCDSYTPSPRLRQLIEIRDEECAVPGCDVPAARCELDHIQPFDSLKPAGGQTVAANLQPLCKSHHQLKTHHGWVFSRDSATGTTTVVTHDGTSVSGVGGLSP
ncbi:MAG: HNH endonuclease [Bifidobacteriaceae bacterium]|nr:HNH endonuclease [Bifidobacteriaceae bacterium]